MRIGMVSALCAVLSLICSPRSAVAQSNPPNLKPPQATLRSLPLPVKLSELPGGAESRGIASRTDLKNEPTNVVRSLRALVIHQEGASPTGIQSPTAASRCAHILIFQAPTMDSKMIIEVPRESIPNMPRLDGLQPCCEDFRRAMVIPHLVPFMGPGRIGPLAPNFGMPSYGIRP